METIELNETVADVIEIDPKGDRRKRLIKYTVIVAGALVGAVLLAKAAGAGKDDDDESTESE